MIFIVDQESEQKLVVRDEVRVQKLVDGYVVANEQEPVDFIQALLDDMRRDLGHHLIQHLIQSPVQNPVVHLFGQIEYDPETDQYILHKIAQISEYVDCEEGDGDEERCELCGGTDCLG